jgi:hypothetical protein
MTTAHAEELEVLSSIYLSDLTRGSSSSSSSAFTVRIPRPSPAADDEPHLLLCFALPATYPASSPPVLSIVDSAHCFSGEERMAMLRAAQAVWEEQRGEVCCYQQVEAIREMVVRLVEERQEERGRREAESAEEAAAVDELLHDNEEDQEAAWESSRAEAAGSIVVQPPVLAAAVQLQSSDASFPFVSGSPVTERRSVFQAHVAALTSPSALPPLLQAVRSHPRLSRATHNMLAYRLSSESYAEDGCEDDGEERAGGRLLHLLQAMQAVNVLVVVSRWYGGVKLGSDRFRIINNVARELLESGGWGADRRRDTAGAAAAAGGRKAVKQHRPKR